MLKNVTGSEADTFGEVNKVLNKIIDNHNSVENKVLVLEETTAKTTWVKAWVNKLIEPMKKGAK